MRIWSEVPKRRTQEVVADLATAAWVAFWAYLGFRLYDALSQLAVVGTSIGDVGESFESAAAPSSAPCRRSRWWGRVPETWWAMPSRDIGGPLVDVGADLERLLLIIAAVLGLLLVAVALIPWLNRYIPWRRRRWSELNAGDRAIRRSPAVRASEVADADLQRVLAARALYRLDYADLLDQSPDPIGDFVGGRYDRLARAELESVGLQERRVGDG